MRVLVVATDSAPSRALASDLQGQLFAVELASPAEVTHSEACVDYQIIVVDLDDPAMNGFSFFRALRRSGWSGRILALKTSSTVSERVGWLNAGADEVLSKPVDAQELAARICALMRRGAAYAPVLRIADLELDPVRRTVRRGTRTINLTAREFDLLEFMVRNRERPLSRSSIVRHVWNDEFDGLSNVVDVYITYLRRKIDDGFPAKLICTARGIGYAVREPEGRRQRDSDAALTR